MHCGENTLFSYYLQSLTSLLTQNVKWWVSNLPHLCTSESWKQTSSLCWAERLHLPETRESVQAPSSHWASTTESPHLCKRKSQMINMECFPAEILHVIYAHCICRTRDIPSPPEASSSPFGLKRTTFTALVCLARLDRNSTTAFPSPSLSTRHNCRIKPKYITHEKYKHTNACIFFSQISWHQSESLLPVWRPPVVSCWFKSTHNRCK